MNGRLAQNATLLGAVAAAARGLPARVGVAVCVPFPYLAQAQAVLGNSTVAWGAEDVSAHAGGAFTGEVAASMVAEFGARFAIVGHSERRTYNHESSELVASKALRAFEAGLTPIVCVGETLEERESDLTEQVVGAQLRAVLDVLTDAQAAAMVLAYEPVWAIGTGRSASSAQAQQVHAYLRGVLAQKSVGAAGIALLYGGSVKAANAAELFGQDDIDGGLIGGAALDAAEFAAICDAAAS